MFVQSSKTLGTKKCLPISFRVISAPPCVNATYRLPAIAISARHGPPGPCFLFSDDVAGWNEYAQLVHEDLQQDRRTILIRLLPRVTASLPPLQSSPRRINVRQTRFGHRRRSACWSHKL